MRRDEWPAVLAAHGGQRGRRPARLLRTPLDREPLRRMRHDHRFEEVENGTLMFDRFELELLPVLDSLVLAPHFRKWLRRRNQLLKRAAEGDASRYLPDPAALLATYDAQVRG